jgi:hypothetical protein
MMDFDSAVKTINELLTKKQPHTFNSSWIREYAPKIYRFIQKNIRREIGGISKLEGRFPYFPSKDKRGSNLLGRDVFRAMTGSGQRDTLCIIQHHFLFLNHLPTPFRIPSKHKPVGDALKF